MRIKVNLKVIACTMLCFLLGNLQAMDNLGGELGALLNGFGANFGGAGDVLGNVISGAGKLVHDGVGDLMQEFDRRSRERAAEARAAAEKAERNADAKMEKIKQDLADDDTPDEIKVILQEKLRAILNAQTKATERAAKNEEWWEDQGKEIHEIGKNFAKQELELFGQLQRNLLEEQKAANEQAREVEKIAIKAAQERKGFVDAAKVKAKHDAATAIETLKLKLGAVKDPKFIAGAALIASGIFGAWHGAKLAAQLLEHYYKNPVLAEETSLLSPYQKLKARLLDIKYEDKVSDVILEPELAERIEVIAKSVKNTVRNNGYFANILFYGPAGTGKTMLAKRIARSSGLEYIYFAASALDQFSLKESIINLTQLFEFAKRSSQKLMIVIDEAEILFENRAHNMDKKTRKMLTHLLTYTGTESRDFVLVLLTNRPEDLDSAVLSRCDEQIKIDAPNAENRRKILRMYIQKYLRQPVAQESVKQNWLQKHIVKHFVNSMEIKPLIWQKGVFSKTALDAIAARLENFVGRDISKLVLAIQSSAYATEDRMVTTELVNHIVDIKVKQKEQELAGFDKPVRGKGK